MDLSGWVGVGLGGNCDSGRLNKSAEAFERAVRCIELLTDVTREL